MKTSIHQLSRVRAISTAAAMAALLTSATLNAQVSELRMTPIVRAVQAAKPSVVNIQGRKTVQGTVSNSSSKQVNGMGTGVVIDPRGYVITNYHVVQDVGRIQVRLADRRTVIARLITHDPETDLAIIKIPADDNLPVIKIGQSDDLMEGETVIAVGNAYGYEHTVTRGIVSSLHRSVQVSDDQWYYDLIQTDASINPGNSGGPLLNIEGEMIGLNVAVRVGAQGIGFAIPIDQAMEIASRLMSVRRLEGLEHGLVGRTVKRGDKTEFEVTSVLPGSPAERAGVKPNDVVANIEGTNIYRALDVERAVLGHSAGESLDITVNRMGDAERFTMTVARTSGTKSTDGLSEKIWNQLGLRLVPVPSTTFKQYRSEYSGGMRVASVRPSSPAASQGVRKGDILLGLHLWETVNLDNVAFILNHKDLAKLQPIKFYILRSGDTLFGHMRVASLKK